MRLSEVREIARHDGAITVTYSAGPEPLNPTFTFTHDKTKGLFILTRSDGGVERFPATEPGPAS